MKKEFWEIHPKIDNTIVVKFVGSSDPDSEKISVLVEINRALSRDERAVFVSLGEGVNEFTCTMYSGTFFLSAIMKLGDEEWVEMIYQKAQYHLLESGKMEEG
ncbi:MAG: hypothetical protein HZA35_04145 [Parcubacteria group bacterium]|nr:hypothetical protein [Parcubacteria group bacterium]